MLLKRMVLENVRSFRDRQEFIVDGKISIIIGPNGGGKTNLLDSILIMIRKYLFGAYELIESKDFDEPTFKYQEDGSHFNELKFEKHSMALDSEQWVEIEIEVTQSDIESMAAIQAGAEELKKDSMRRIVGDPWEGVDQWDMSQMFAGMLIVYRWSAGNLQHPMNAQSKWFLKFLQISEIDNFVRSEQNKTLHQTPILYLPVNRSANSFQPQVSLANFNFREQRRGTRATYSRSPGNYVQLAVSQLASRYRLLEAEVDRSARDEFLADERVRALTADLRRLGYDWDLETINPLNNTYSVKITKQGTSFTVANASLGERELLTYLFAIHALNVRDALILIDEPELHLHPRWQAALLSLFERLATDTGNQFVMATHSPTFVSPTSIRYVSRVYSENQQSKIIRLDSSALPDAKHLFKLINSQNNERIFFADSVLLVEGVTDRIFFEKVLDLRGGRALKRGDKILEVVSVGGKTMFNAYKSILNACQVKSMVIADLDYVNEVGTDNIRSLLSTNPSKVRKSLIKDATSIDASDFVRAVNIALDSGDWDHAKEIWEYIKSRHTNVRPDLSQEERGILEEFLEERRMEGVYILKEGQIEDYLPEGYAGKDLNKVIKLVHEPDFWDKLPYRGREEIGMMIDRILRSVGLA